MQISLIPLNTKGRVDFDLFPEITDFKVEELKKIENLHVIGSIIDNGTDEYEINMNISGDMILKSAKNGSDVYKDLQINYHDFVENLVENYKINTNTLDIFPIVWENILLEIPIRAVNSNDEFVKEAGIGWEVISENE